MSLDIDAFIRELRSPMAKYSKLVLQSLLRRAIDGDSIEAAYLVFNESSIRLRTSE